MQMTKESAHTHTPTVNEQPTTEFVTLTNHEDYEILNVHPFNIRKKSNHYVVKVSLSNGYPRVKLNGKDFDDDSSSKTKVDHINRDTNGAK